MLILIMENIVNNTIDIAQELRPQELCYISFHNNLELNYKSFYLDVILSINIFIIFFN